MTVAILGGGSWGTALAIHLAKNAGAVRLWAREPEVVEGIRARRRSPWYLPDLDIPASVAATTDAAEAVNGLRVANSGKVTRVGAAVDLNEATVRLAAEQAVDLLLVHHGLFWGGLQPLTGPHYRRVAELLRHDIAVYSAHLPLDVHPEVGNNSVLARALGVTIRSAFGDHHGEAIGVWGDLAVPREALRDRLATHLGATVKLMPFGPVTTQRVGIVTGSGGVSRPSRPRPARAKTAATVERGIWSCTPMPQAVPRW